MSSWWNRITPQTNNFPSPLFEIYCWNKKENLNNKIFKYMNVTVTSYKQQIVAEKSQNNALKILRDTPPLVLWGILLTRNSILYDEKFFPPLHIAAQLNVLLAHYKCTTKVNAQITVGKVQVNKSYAWELFNGGCQSPRWTNVIFLALHLSDHHFFNAKALKFLLKLALEKKIVHLLYSNIATMPRSKNKVVVLTLDFSKAYRTVNCFLKAILFQSSQTKMNRDEH